jgi:hypothetical protein
VDFADHARGPHLRPMRERPLTRHVSERHLAPSPGGVLGDRGFMSGLLLRPFRLERRSIVQPSPLPEQLGTEVLGVLEDHRPLVAVLGAGFGRERSMSDGREVFGKPVLEPSFEDVTVESSPATEGRRHQSRRSELRLDRARRSEMVDDQERDSPGRVQHPDHAEDTIGQRNRNQRPRAGRFARGLSRRRSDLACGHGPSLLQRIIDRRVDRTARALHAAVAVWWALRRGAAARRRACRANVVAALC